MEAKGRVEILAIDRLGIPLGKIIEKFQTGGIRFFGVELKSKNIIVADRRRKALSVVSCGENAPRMHRFKNIRVDKIESTLSA